MLISPRKDQAAAYDTYWKYPTEHYKIAWDATRNLFFIIFVTAIFRKPTPEIRFFGAVVMNALAQGGLWRFTPWPWIKSPNLPIERRTLNHWAITAPTNVRRQCLGVRWCYDVPLRRCWGTNDRRKRIKLVFTIYRYFTQGLFHQILKGGAI